MRTQRELRLRTKLRNNFPFYARNCLRIRTKQGELAPLILNKAQRYLHEKVQEQLADKGYVRIIVLKGRQQGISTYIEGLGYQIASHRKGYRAFILTHEKAATQNLFDMARRYHENCPEFVRPETDSDSAKTLSFAALDSDYAVGTAGTKGTGRSGTVQFFHGSEVAFWPNAKDHAAGVLQSLPLAPDTYSFLESTADGMGNYYHKIWQDSVAGIGDYQAVFIPWYWQDEYQRPLEGALDEDEKDYASRYGLSDEQMAWRRAKIIELESVEQFRQEYPATPEEAFSASNHAQFMAGDDIEDAFEPKSIDPVGAKILSLDVARFGDDRNVAGYRQGRYAKILGVWSKTDTMDTVGRFKQMLDEHKPDKAFIDVIGVGAGVVDRLHEMGYSMVVAASASNAALNADKYPNKRNEMYGELREWMKDKPCYIERNDELQSELSAISVKRFDSKGRMQLESKDEMKAAGMRSPDLADALALTFFEPVDVGMTDWLPEIHEASSWMS